MISLAVVAPHRERCGVADYARELAASLSARCAHGCRRPARRRSPLPPGTRRRGPRPPPDVVHLHYETALFEPVKPYRDRLIRFLRAVGRPRLVTLHGPVPRLLPRWGEPRPYGAGDLLRDLAYLPFFRGWERRHYQLAEHWIVHTAALESEVAQWAGADCVTRLPHPVPPSRLQWRIDAAVPDTLVSLGFIKPHKGYGDLLPAVAARPTWRWLLAGAPQHERDEVDARTLIDEVQRRGLGERIALSGYQERADLNCRAVRARLAVFPFRSSGGSGSIAWAIALGMPIAATDLPSVRSLVEAGAGIALLPAGQPARWEEMLATLMDDGERLQTLARLNLAFAAHETFAAHAAQVAALARRLTAPAARGAA